MKAAIFGQIIFSSRLLEAEVVEEESDIEESDEECTNDLVDRSSGDEGKSYEELSAKHTCSVVFCNRHMKEPDFSMHADLWLRTVRVTWKGLLEMAYQS